MTTDVLSIRLRGNGLNPVEVLILNRRTEELLTLRSFAQESDAIKFANATRDALAKVPGFKVGAGVYWEDYDKSQSAILGGGKSWAV